MKHRIYKKINRTRTKNPKDQNQINLVRFDNLVFQYLYPPLHFINKYRRQNIVSQRRVQN